LGFQALAKDTDLKTLGIALEFGNILSKNSNAVVDKACAEIELELTKLQPKPAPISQTMLAKAVITVNSKIRRKDKLSAIEIHFARSQITHDNLPLDDNHLRGSQLAARRLTQQTPSPHLLKPGDIVVPAIKPPKHNAKDIYIVTDTSNDTVNVQKLADNHAARPQLRSKVITTHLQHLLPLYQPVSTSNIVPDSTDTETFLINNQPTATWHPIPANYYAPQDSDDEDDDAPLPPPPIIHHLQQ
jgi:hypothetical protein